MNLAPIVLFVYNRKIHTERTLNALSNNHLAKDSELFIFSDGPKNKNDEYAVNEVRNFIKSVIGFKRVSYFYRETNLGLANNIIDGINNISREYGRVIILEDDILTSPYFLKYMNDALEFYKDELSVASIHGYTYPVNSILPETFFLRGADCWGWATWDRAWKNFEPNGALLLERLMQNPNLKLFDFNGSFGFIKMLKANVAGLNNSWAIRWNASAFLANQFTLYSGNSLVQNIGNDNSGTHTKVATNEYEVHLKLEPVNIIDIPIEDSAEARNAFEIFFRKRRSISYKIHSYFASIIAVISKIFTHSVLKKIYFKTFQFRFKGPFLNMLEAAQKSDGYDDKMILEKVRYSLLLVKNKLAIAERDSLILNKVEYSWPVITALCWAAAKNKGRLSVLDFGGSLGSSYFQYQHFISCIEHVSWGIVEQPHFYEVGKNEFEDGRLCFFESIEECINSIKPNVILLSSVLQYLDDPYIVIKKLTKIKNTIIIIDRTPFSSIDIDSIYIQKVPGYIYKTSYPLHIFGCKMVQNTFGSEWNILQEFYSNDNQYLYAGGKPVKFKGIILTPKT